jgi:hypothetical protein
VNKGAITAHPAIRAQGLGDFRRNRVHREKLKQKAVLTIKVSTGWLITS